MVTRDDIRKTIKSLGLENRPVCLHTSLRSFGRVTEGPATLIDAFLGEGCTVLVPTFSAGFGVPPPSDDRPRQNAWIYGVYFGPTEGMDRIYTPESNEINMKQMGIVPAYVLSLSDRVRGNHPLCSFSAVGPLAHELIVHQSPLDVFAPLRALAENDGWVVLAGVGIDRMTLLHAAEEIAGRHPFIRWANGPDGKPIRALSGGCSDGFPKLESTLRPLMRSAQVGLSQWSVFPVKRTLEVASHKIKKDPDITHCGDPGCRLCNDAVRGGPVDD